MSQAHAQRDDCGLICPSCGYNLTSLTNARCPECGRRFAVALDERDRKKHPMRSLGEAVGILWRAIRANPAKKTIRKAVEEDRHGDITLRRTTIEEIEVRPESAKRATPNP